MAINSRGLGRGIQALFDSASSGEQVIADSSIPYQVAQIEKILPNPQQPRKTFNEDKLQELADSIKVHGILQPLVVRTGENGCYQLIAGERRLRAAKLAGVTEVPVIVRELSNQDVLIVTLLENLQREDLNPIEEARGIEALRVAMNANLEELASTLGQPRSSVSNALRLLALDPLIQEDVEKKRISTSQAKILAGLPNKELTLVLRDRIVAKNLTTRAVQEAVDFWHANQRFPWESIQADEQAAKKIEGERDEYIVRISHDLAKAYESRIKIKGTSDKGRISIVYESRAQLSDLLNGLGIRP